jgi:hypothetical protein
MIRHLILDILLFLAILVFPWWVSVFLATFLLYYLKSFNEIVLFGLIMDIYYGRFSSTFNLFDYRFFLVFLVLLLSSFYFKKRLKFYHR